MAGLRETGAEAVLVDALDRAAVIAVVRAAEARVRRMVAQGHSLVYEQELGWQRHAS